MNGNKSQTFLLILAASFFMLLIYTLKFSPKIKQGSETTIILTGDVMLGRTVMTKSLDLNNPGYPFEKVSDELNEADLVFVNLENPIISNCPRSTESLIFCADPAMAEGLVAAGIDIANLANNHSRNYGEKGLSKTIEILDEKEISITGLGELVIKDIKRKKYGFLGFDFISKTPKENDYELVA